MPSADPNSNKAICQRFHDAINSNDLELIDRTIDDLATPDLAFHAPVPLGETGPRALKRVMSALHQAYRDLHVAIEDVIAEGD
jgi:non-canonical (house-cleaning) NTP pyrophosphatase